MSRTVALDWDGVLCDTQTGEWLPGSREAVGMILATGRKVVIHTCKANWPEGLNVVNTRLAAAGLLHRNLSVHTGPGKPEADLYVDDRAVCFTGDWDVVFRHPNMQGGGHATKPRPAGAPARAAAIPCR